MVGGLMGGVVIGLISAYGFRAATRAWVILI